MYLLLNKNRVVAAIETEYQDGIRQYCLRDAKKDALPIGIEENAREWINNRKASKHNHHLAKLMADCQCDTPEGFIRLTHAASLNDTFWIKEESESVRWEDVSLYTNEFDEVVSRLAFEGIGLFGIKFSATTPELSTGGSFRKCWRRESGEIYLYKRGSMGASNTGLEPYGEVLASEIALQICPGSVPYKLSRLNSQIASKCRLFTSEDYGYVPIARMIRQSSVEPEELLHYYRRLGSEEEFRRMVILDCLTFNTDRHMGNYGVLINNDTLQAIKMAPVFDLNFSLFPLLATSQLENIGERIDDFVPCIGNDFTRIGQKMLTSEIRTSLIALKGFTFSWRGDFDFPEARVKILEDVVHRQLDAILKKEILHTRDVFVPEVTEIKKERKQKAGELREIARKIGDRFLTEGLCESFYVLTDVEQINVVLSNPAISETEIAITVPDKSMRILLDEEKIDYEKIRETQPKLWRWYCQIAMELDELSLEKTKKEAQPVKTAPSRRR